MRHSALPTLKNSTRPHGAKLFLNKSAPDFIRLPDGVQIFFRLDCRNSFFQNSIKKHESGHSHVHRAMHEDRSLLERLHYACKCLKIATAWRLKIHRYVHVCHTQGSHEAAFIRDGIGRCRKRQIDYGLEPCVAYRSELLSGWLPARPYPLSKSAESRNTG